jgi:hypothetical protein
VDEPGQARGAPNGSVLPGPWPCHPKEPHEHSTMPHATFGTSKKKLVAVLARAQVMYNALLAAAAILGVPPVTAAAFLVLINAVVSAQQNVTAKIRGAATPRNTKRDALWTSMGTLRKLLEGVPQGFYAPLTPETRLARSENSGVSRASRTGTRGGRGQEAPETPWNTLYQSNWQSTIDGGKTIVTLPSTPKGTTVLSNLTPLTTVGVRVSLTNGEGTGDWSQFVSILVQ